MKKDFFSFGYLILLSVTFLIISFLVYLTRGQNSKLLGHKLRLGALIIALTATISCSPSQPRYYEQVAVNHFEIKSSRETPSTPVIETDKDKNIKGAINGPTVDTFSYLIYDWNKKVIQSGDIKPSDGKFNSAYEKFEIELKDVLPSGLYSIHFFPVSEKDRKDDMKSYMVVEFRALKSNEPDPSTITCYIVIPPDNKDVKEPPLQPRFQHLCYSPVGIMPTIVLSKTDPSLTSQEFKQGENNVIKGEIRDVRGEDFSFRIEDRNSKLIQNGPIKPSDGKWDGKTEDYEIQLSNKLSPGEYAIYMFEVPEKEQDKDLSHFLNSYIIKIVE